MRAGGAAVEWLAGWPACICCASKMAAGPDKPTSWARYALIYINISLVRFTAMILVVMNSTFALVEGTGAGLNVKAVRPCEACRGSRSSLSIFDGAGCVMPSGTSNADMVPLSASHLPLWQARHAPILSPRRTLPAGTEEPPNRLLLQLPELMLVAA